MNKIRNNPAAELLGATINGWQVVKKIDKSNTTGGHFSHGYIVENDDGESAFLKALDYSNAFNNPLRQVDILKSMTEAYIFERDLLLQCREKKSGTSFVCLSMEYIVMSYGHMLLTIYSWRKLIVLLAICYH